MKTKIKRKIKLLKYSALSQNPEKYALLILHSYENSKRLLTMDYGKVEFFNYKAPLLLLFL